MTGELYINEKDAWTTWGVNMGEGFLDAIDDERICGGREQAGGRNKDRHGKSESGLTGDNARLHHHGLFGDGLQEQEGGVPDGAAEGGFHHTHTGSRHAEVQDGVYRKEHILRSQQEA